jgi:hypothetical protein
MGTIPMLQHRLIFSAQFTFNFWSFLKLRDSATLVTNDFPKR